MIIQSTLFVASTSFIIIGGLHVSKLAITWSNDIPGEQWTPEIVQSKVRVLLQTNCILSRVCICESGSRESFTKVSKTDDLIATLRKKGLALKGIYAINRSTNVFEKIQCESRCYYNLGHS